MKQYLHFPWKICGITISCLITNSHAQAQIIPDATLPNNSNIIQQETTSVINEGTRAGSNLFHSFEQFSVPNGGTAYFNNALDIQNIISRVTGSYISNIDGAIQANGNTNLFLLNPNGIIIGPSAQLNIGGSFLASTASSMNFADGTLFTNNDPQTASLLTVSVPIGLGFNSNPGVIRVQGTGHSLVNAIYAPIVGRNSLSGLRVQPGKTLALIGGDLALEGGVLTAEQGQIELGSIGFGTVSFSSNIEGWSFNYENVQNFQDIYLSQQALVDTSGAIGGSITVQGRKVFLSDGSAILIQNQGIQSSRGISVNSSDSLEVDGTSPDGRIASTLLTESVGSGRGGDIAISTKRLVVQSGGQLLPRTFGLGSGGDLTVNASDSTQVIGYSPLYPTLFSNISAATFGPGVAGNLSLSTNNLTGTDGIQIGSATFGSGAGGNVTVKATTINLSGVVPNFFTPSTINTATFSSGNAGRSIINTSKLLLTNGGAVASSTGASGDAGSIIINASDSVEVSGTVSGTATPSLVDSSAIILAQPLQQQLRLPPVPSGDSGDITISTKNLSVRDGGLLNVRNAGPGNAGTLLIKAELIQLDNSGGITATTASGQGGDIFLQAQDLRFRNNSAITATAQGGSGNGGNITIDTDTLTALENSDITANAFKGRGGNIQINTQGLFLSPDSEIRASSEAGPQFDGVVQVNTPDIDFTRATVQPVGEPESPEIASVCQGRSGTAINKLTDTGTGGVPASPTAPLSSNTGWQDDSLSTQVTQNSREPERSTTDKSMQIVEAQGWKRNANGTVSMTTEATETVPYSSLATPSCSTDHSTGVNVENFRR